MPTILVINPNSTEAMTRSAGRAAEAVASPGTVIRAVNPPDSPPAIQGPEDGAACLPPLFRTFDAEMAKGDVDAVVIACFDDTGLDELKARSPVPVLGIGEAAYHVAMMLGRSFSVVTTLAASIPVLEENVQRYGFAGRRARIRASGVPVLELESKPVESEARISDEIGIALAEEHPDVIVLGCSGMADLAGRLSARHEVPVVDGVAAAVGLAEALVRVTAR